MIAPTIRDLLREGQEYLSRHGVANARRNAEWILCRSLACSPLYLHVESAGAPSPGQVRDFRARLARRGEREPLQLVLETAGFMSLEFEVSRGVFVPRPETETLVEIALAEFDAVPPLHGNVLDICCGSGVVGISMAYSAPRVRVYAADISPAAARLSRRNARRLGVDERYTACCCEVGALLDGAHGTEWPGRFDLIVGNPPYVATREISELEPEVQDWDPVCALDGGPDGLDFYRRVAPRLDRRLAPGGVIVLEIGSAQGDAARKIVEGATGAVTSVHPDRSGRDRVLVARKPPGVRKG